jgi:penicillin amidase
MSLLDLNPRNPDPSPDPPSEPIKRGPREPDGPQPIQDHSEAQAAREGRAGPAARRSATRRLKILGVLVVLLAVLATGAFFFGRYYLRKLMVANLPQLDGSLVVYGLSAPVTVERDARGVPRIRANSVDDLVLAQGYVTAQDRLWQMDLLRRHAAGQLAAILGRSMLDHDRLQRTLQLRTVADRVIAAMPADQKHWLEVYAHGVNASIVAQHDHLPIEFRVLGYRPGPWTPRDSVLVELAMFQDLTTGFPEKLGREALAARLSPELIADLYPTGSWRDHAPGQPIPDVTAPQQDMPDVPLDESQSKLHQPARPRTKSTWSAPDLLALERSLALFHAPCGACVAGSNAWAVSGSRSASGEPLLANDMHLSLQVPELWYEADLEAANPAPMAEFHARRAVHHRRPQPTCGLGIHQPRRRRAGPLHRAHPRHPLRRRVPDRQRHVATRPVPHRDHPGARRRRCHPGRAAHQPRGHRHPHRLQHLSV